MLPGDALLLVLALVNITFTCTTYVAASVLICVSCQRAACLVKSGNQNISGDGVRVEVAEPAVQGRAGEGRVELSFESLAYRTFKSTFCTYLLTE